MDTIGNLIDKLSIVNIRIWFAEDIKRDRSASDKQIADACRITNIANSQRNDLIQEIDECLNKLASTGALQRTYSQGTTKMYGRRYDDAVRVQTESSPTSKDGNNNYCELDCP